MRSLDSLLLFMTTVFGIVFSILNLLLSQKEFVYSFVPLLVIGAAIPIYVGYIRGAIILDSLEERVRGWVYFLNGVFLYLFYTILFAASTLISNLTAELQALSKIMLFTGYVVSGYFLGAGYLRDWFCDSIFGAFKVKISLVAEKVFKDTATSAYETSLYLFLGSSGLTQISEVETIMKLIFLALALMTFVVNEMTIRELASLLQFSDFLEVEFKKRELRRTFRIVSQPLIFISIGALALLWIASDLLPISAKILLLVLGLAGLLVVMLGTPKEQPIVKLKSNVPKDIEDKVATLANRLTKQKELKK